MNGAEIIATVSKLRSQYIDRTGKAPNTVRMTSWDFGALIMSGGVSTFPPLGPVKYQLLGMGIYLNDCYPISCYYEEPKYPEIICCNCGAPSIHKTCDYCKTERTQ